MFFGTRESTHNNQDARSQVPRDTSTFIAFNIYQKQNSNTSTDAFMYVFNSESLNLRL
jgi:hypothetical protein